MAKKIPSNFLTMTISLTLIGLISAGILGTTYFLTYDQIQENRIAKTLDSIIAVSPEFNNNPLAEATEGQGTTIYPLLEDNQLVGYAVKSLSTTGYGGEMEILIGFTPGGRIRAARVLSHKETPGLGSKITQEAFLEQFLDLDPRGFNFSVAKDGGDVDAITAATISSRAFSSATARAVIALNDYLGEEQ